MAHSNIESRREAVRSQLNSTGRIDSAMKRLLANQFSCSTAAISADIIALTVRTSGTIHTSKKVRERVRNRDGNICQYCLSQIDFAYVEHVIPAALGGVAKEYNLVVSCQPCNLKKRRGVLIPRNFYEITKSHLEWRHRILLMACQTAANDLKKDRNQKTAS